ncbi:hypothetical protein PYW08_016152 [Mythimna loreyi]|uniref:Uncharacterized protein n=1 Tax=Mythimna loreyi TaxID=667449 RepID=A0ACC2QXW2_9NEOP|nr:hypothetical protein PYW08_016152 [Mythimna loreyi]
MISDALPKWTGVICILVSGVYSQMPMGFGYGGPIMMPPPPPPMPVPMPMPVPVPFGVPIPYQESTSTTTTTEATREEEIRIPIAIPMPVPHIVQVAIPGVMPQNCMPNNKNNENGAKNKNCPPCPPCSCNPCTPSFFSFCSPCHLECRCKNGKENPTPREPNAPQPFPGPAFPMPIPMPAPGPVVIVPFPPQFVMPKKPNRRPTDSDCESHRVSNSCSDESYPGDSCESTRKKKRKRSRGKNRKRKKNFDIHRRNFGYVRNRGDKRNGFAEPVLSYMSRNGDIKVERRLSNDEANALLDGKRPYENEEPYNNRAKKSYTHVYLTAGEDSNNRKRLILRSDPGERYSEQRLQRRQRQDLPFGNAQSSLDQYNLGDGKKEMLFRTPDNKTITNLTVSFQITK